MFKEPDPQGGPHEVLIDRDGMIWLPELLGVPPTKAKRLLGFDSKTEQWELHGATIDRNDNVWVALWSGI